MGLKLVGDRGPSFFLMARICSSARKAARKKRAIRTARCRREGGPEPRGATRPPPRARPLGPGSHPPRGSGLTQSADGAVVGLVAQGVCAGVTQAEVAAGQDQGVPHVGEAHHALGAIVAHFILSHLPGDRRGFSRGPKDPLVPRLLCEPACRAETRNTNSIARLHASGESAKRVHRLGLTASDKCLSQGILAGADLVLLTPGTEEAQKAGEVGGGCTEGRET